MSRSRSWEYPDDVDGGLTLTEQVARSRVKTERALAMWKESVANHHIQPPLSHEDIGEPIPVPAVGHTGLIAFGVSAVVAVAAFLGSFLLAILIEGNK